MENKKTEKKVSKLELEILELESKLAPDGRDGGGCVSDSCLNTQAGAEC